MEFLPILQGLSTPLLLVIGGIAYRGMQTLHDIDKRMAIVETKLETIKNGNSI
jgi:hypothetical protein